MISTGGEEKIQYAPKNNTEDGSIKISTASPKLRQIWMKRGKS